MEGIDFKTMLMTSINLKYKRGDKTQKYDNSRKIILEWELITFPLHIKCQMSSTT